MRTKAKRDANEPEIVAALRAHGIGVYRNNDPGLPDLLCWREERHWTDIKWTDIKLMEVKGSRGRLTAAQRRYGGPRIVIRTAAEALACFGIVE